MIEVARTSSVPPQHSTMVKAEKGFGRLIHDCGPAEAELPQFDEMDPASQTHQIRALYVRLTLHSCPTLSPFSR